MPRNAMDASAMRRWTMDGNLSEAFLVQGAFYAMEQAGHLLQDAILLFNRNRYASSLALASYSREEMWRAWIMMEKAFKVQGGGTVTGRLLDEELRRGGVNAHRRKLSRGARSVPVFPNKKASKRALDLFGWFNPQPNAPTRVSSEDHSKAIQQIKVNIADETFDMRKRVLYVDPLQGHTRWNRPIEVTRDEALGLLKRVSRDYRADREGFQRLQEMLERSNKCGYENWSARPDLPRVDLSSGVSG